jgi:hypothetical protein
MGGGKVFSSARRLAACQNNRPSYCPRLCACAQRPVRHSLSRRRADRSRARQSQHPQAGFTIRGVPARRSTPSRGAVRMALHGVIARSQPASLARFKTPLPGTRPHSTRTCRACTVKLNSRKACPSRAKHAFATRYNRWHISQGFVEGAPRSTRSNDQCTRAGSTRSRVQHIRSAKASGTKLACPGCPWLAPEPHMGRFGSRDEIHTRMNNTPAAVSVSKV